MLKKLKTIAAGVALAATAFTAQANVISAAVNVAAGDVEYWAFDYAFDVLPGGSITTFTVGATTIFTEDPHLCVFRSSVSLANLVGCDDDSGSGFNASLTFNNPFLTAGTFIVALSGYQLTVADALSGSNPDGAAFASTLTVSTPSFFGISNPFVSNLREVNAVPEPGTLALVGLALAGIGAQRKRAAKK